LLLLKRWLVAQEAERQSWSDPTHALKDADGWLNFIKSSFSLDSIFFDEKVIMEVGCGPYGAIHFVNCSEWFKVGIDPEQYSNIWKNLSIKIPHVVAVGEFLPLRGDVVDVVICFNVLDHVFNPKKVVDEATSVLKRKGKLLLWVVTIRNFLKVVSAFLNKVDKPHPYHFTLQTVLNFLEGNDLKVTRVTEESFQKGKLFSNCIRSLLHGRFKVAIANFLVFNTYIIAEKQ
jgi:SAM-dependent methyltransferase